MKNCIILLALLGSMAAPTIFAQSLSLFDVDTSAYPTMKAKFFAYDAKGNQARPSINELTLKENGIARTITNVSCPPEKKRVVSMCIMVDTYKYIDLARSGTERLIGFLNMQDEDEVALTYMDRMASIWQDFTKDRAKAIEKAKTIPEAPGVDVNTMFYSDYTGGIPMIQSRTSDKKVLVLVSDLHCPNLNINESQLIADAKRDNISIYTVLLGTTDYSGLFKRIAEGTLGKVYENVKNVTDIENVFSTIARLENNEECVITWEGNPSCTPNISVELDWQSQRSLSKYALPLGVIPSLEVSPMFIAFGKQLPANIIDSKLTLTAQNFDYSITDIRRSFGSANFTIHNTTFPLLIPKNTSKTITLRFAPTDSSMSFASFEIETNLCNGYFSTSGGFPGKKTIAPTLKLTHPNGGETFVVGSDTLITWTGVAPTDTVRLEFSSDGGARWKLISDKATGLSYRWENIPAPPSTKCLVRVSQEDKSSGKTDIIPILTLTGHSKNVFGIAYSPDGRYVATANGDGTTKIWDANTGVLIRTLSGHRSMVRGISYSPDGRFVATVSYDLTAKIWDAITGELVNTLYGHSDFLLGISYSPDGRYVATASGDHTAKIWDTLTGLELLTLTGHTDLVIDIAYSPDGTYVATASADSTAKIWDANTGALIRTITGHTNWVSGIAYSPDGSYIATSSWDSTAKIWDAMNGSLIRTLTGHTDWVYGIAYSPDGSNIATASVDNSAKIWDASSGALQITLTGHWSHVLDITYSPDGRSVATASWDSTAKIWELEVAPLQQDVSDAVFSTIAPEAKFEQINIDMGKVLVGSSKDTMVASVLCNRGIAPLHVLGVDVTNGNTSEFIVPRGAGEFYLQPGECRDMMFAFMPNQIGIRTARITVRTTIGDYTDTIRIQGEGIAPSIVVQNKFIDFGKVTVGEFKDSLQSVTIRNNGSIPITIDKTKYKVPNSSDFITLTGGGSFTLGVGETKLMDLRFAPVDVGRTSGALEFHYNGIGSPATLQLFGEAVTPDTARTTIVVEDISAQAGEQVTLNLVLKKQSGMQVAGSPTEWYARLHHNSTILYNKETWNRCYGRADSCVFELSGTYTPGKELLASIPSEVTLGNTDNAEIVIDEFRWTNSGIVSEVATQNGHIRITGLCEEGTVRLVIPTGAKTSLTCRPNPAQDAVKIEYGIIEPLIVTIEVFDVSGQVVSTLVSGVQQQAGMYSLQADISTLATGVYYLRMTTTNGVLTSRLDVVK